jgi:hypothetical protein
MKEYNFNVKVIREGQPRRYADSEYEYIVTSTLPERLVKLFCIHVLREPTSIGEYEFKKVDENTYNYYICIPFMD